MGVQVPPPAQLTIKIVKTTLQKQNDSRYLFTLQIDPLDYKESFHKKLKEYTKNNQVKGFRKNSNMGVAFLKHKYVSQLRQEIILEMTDQEMHRYIHKNRFMIAENPTPTEETNNINWANETSFQLSYTFEGSPLPQFTLDKKTEIEKYQITSVTDEYLNKYIETVRQMYQTYDPVDTIQEKDIVEGFLFNEQHEQQNTFHFTISEDLNKTIKALGKKLQETITISHKLIEKTPRLFTFLPKTQEKNKDCTIVINNIFRVKLPELNQAFFDKYLGEIKEKTHESFLKEVTKRALLVAQKDADNIFAKKISKVLIEQASATIHEKHKKNEELLWVHIVQQYANDLKIKVDDQKVLEELVGYFKYMVNDNSPTITEDIVELVKQDFQNPKGTHIHVRSRLRQEALIQEISNLVTIKEKNRYFPAGKTPKRI